MNIDLKDRLSRTPASFHPARARQVSPAIARDRSQAGVAEGHAPPTPQMVRDVSRAAWQFQRSAIGHLDHQGWYDRMRHDGQHLMDLLAQMGFTPAGNGSERMSKKS